MKALLLTNDNGLEYEDYSWWVERVLLVPDRFDEIADQKAFYAAGAAAGKWQVMEAGFVYRRWAEKAHEAWKADVTARFETLPHLGGRDEPS